jgi:hypothetical protein
MSAIEARTQLRQPKFKEAWRNEATNTIMSIVELGRHDAHLTFDDPEDARAVALECIKAAEAMERIEGEASGE